MPPSTSPPVLSRWITILLSILIGFHLLTVGMRVIASPSGPWPTMMGSNMATPPQFAFSYFYERDRDAARERPTDDYLRAVKMTHNFHFYTNRPGLAAARFEVKLKDDKGNELATLKFPEDGVNSAVRQRQVLLARALAVDIPVPPPQGESVAAPSQKVRTVTIWDSPDNRGLILRTVPEHLVPRDRPVFRPSDWSVLLAHSYVRHLCREHGAASAELIRYTKEAVTPDVLFMPGQPPAGAFDVLMANFGELSK
jgi:hypothetical protein